MLFPNDKIKDKKFGEKFLKRFPFAIIAKNKANGRLVIMLKSKSGLILQVGTDQREPQILESVK